MAKVIMKRLKFSNIEISTVYFLIAGHMKIFQIPKMRPTKQMAFLLDPRFPDLIKLCEADSKGTYPINLSLVENLKKELAISLEKKAKLEQVVARTKLFTGDNLIELGYNPSNQFKVILDEVNDRIISGEIDSTNDAVSFVLKQFPK
jgi:hypothetical protein